VSCEKTAVGYELWKNKKSFGWKLLWSQFFFNIQISDLKNCRIFKISNVKKFW
jgi:hypothetical protein